jgi:3-phosphoshikimate 1-carboxyvinyltransferase
MSTGSVTVRPAPRLHGVLRVPGDKSIAHRYAMLGALANGTSRFHAVPSGADVLATLSCVQALGATIIRDGSTVTVIGRGLGGFCSPAQPIDARNSGTTTRLLSGLLAAHPFSTTIVGDESLSKRPMRRVIEPLTRMGATIVSTNGCLPMTITGTALSPIDYAVPVPSAQVKSSVLFAGLHADGVTRVTEPIATRNHTELLLRQFGVALSVEGTTVTLAGRQPLHAVDARVPGDISSAAFWLVAAAAIPGSSIRMEGVGLNPTRTGIIDVLRRAGAQITVEGDGEIEPAGTIEVSHGTMRPLVITPADVPGVIDELPVLAALATHGGEITVTGASELRVKESDRITALVTGLRGLGADAEELPDGFHISGRQPLAGGRADAVGDHRLAMAFAVAALGARSPSTIDGAGAVDVSYPGFFDVLDSLRA